MAALIDALKAYLPPGPGYLPYYMFGVRSPIFSALPFSCPVCLSCLSFTLICFLFSALRHFRRQFIAELSNSALLAPPIQWPIRAESLSATQVRRLRSRRLNQ